MQMVLNLPTTSALAAKTWGAPPDDIGLAGALLGENVWELVHWTRYPQGDQSTLTYVLLDKASGAVLAFRTSIELACVALIHLIEKTLAKHGPPDRLVVGRRFGPMLTALADWGHAHGIEVTIDQPPPAGRLTTH